LSDEWYNSVSEDDGEYDLDPLDLAEEVLHLLDRVQNREDHGCDDDITPVTPQTGANVLSLSAHIDVPCENNTSVQSQPEDTTTDLPTPPPPSTNNTDTNTTSIPPSTQATTAP
jgi:hypothetical protein